MRPLIVLNFKTYKESTGQKALALAQKIARVKKSKYKIVVAPPLLNLKEVTEKTSLMTAAQHVDPVSLGAHTGSITIDELKKIGVKGAILNHSERKVPMDVLEDTVHQCRNNKLRTIVCASNISEVKKVAQFRPNYIAYEPPELVGGEVSVTEAKPDLIVKAVDAVKSISPKTKLLCGAGVHTKEDLGQALLLGTYGVLIGHAVPKAKDPKKFLQEMLI